MEKGGVGKTTTTINLGAALAKSGKDRKLQKLAALAALEHHERWDGQNGYIGYKGENISLVGRIVAVADVYDALRTVRPYRPAWEIGRIVSYMVSEKGKGFDPAVIAALLYCLEHKRGLKQTLIH